MTEDRDRCPESPTGEHEPAYWTIVPAHDDQGVCDVECRHCGRSGSFFVPEIEW